MAMQKCPNSWIKLKGKYTKFWKKRTRANSWRKYNRPMAKIIENKRFDP
jgi:hypothetical protein